MGKLGTEKVEHILPMILISEKLAWDFDVYDEKTIGKSRITLLKTVELNGIKSESVLRAGSQPIVQIWARFDPLTSVVSLRALTQFCPKWNRKKGMIWI